MWGPVGVVLGVLIVAGLVAGYFYYQANRETLARLARLRLYWTDPQDHPDWIVKAGQRCGDAPFVMPTDGLIGFLWGDAFRLGHAHQGIDVFGPSGPYGLGETPVVSAYAGYLTRLPDWRSAVIMRVPSDPLSPGRQIWVYYSHMADAEGNSFIGADFPPGTYERFIPAGTLLGYQGNYSGDPNSPTGMHLHFSIVMDDGNGRYRNELEIANTLDPSPYLGVEVNARRSTGEVVVCKE